MAEASCVVRLKFVSKTLATGWNQGDEFDQVGRAVRLSVRDRGI
jgi:hypothetical protein